MNHAASLPRTISHDLTPCAPAVRCPALRAIASACGVLLGALCILGVVLPLSASVLAFAPAALVLPGALVLGALAARVGERAALRVALALGPRISCPGSSTPVNRARSLPAC